MIDSPVSPKTRTLLLKREIKKVASKEVTTVAAESAENVVEVTTTTISSSHVTPLPKTKTTRNPRKFQVLLHLKPRATTKEIIIVEGVTEAVTEAVVETEATEAVGTETIGAVPDATTTRAATTTTITRTTIKARENTTRGSKEEEALRTETNRLSKLCTVK